MKTLIITAFLLFFFGNAFGQTTTCNCCTAEYKQFDFWIGNWEVFDTAGNKLGENKIVSLQDSCLIQENWTTTGQTGTSYNYYNKVDSSWTQVYIDNTGSVLELRGGFVGNKMLLKSKKMVGKRIPFYHNQITWEQDKSGNVLQIWDITDEQDKVLRNVFYGIYKRKKL